MRTILTLTVILTSACIAQSQSSVSTLADEPVGDDIHLAVDGNLYTSHYGGDRIRKISPSGEVTTILEVDITTIGAIEVAPNMTIYLTSYDEGWVGKFREGNDEIDIIATDIPSPAGVDLGADFKLYITSNVTQTVLQMDTTGANIETFYLGSPLFYPTGICSDPDNNIYISNLLNGDVSKLNSGAPGEVLATIPFTLDNTEDLGYLDYDPNNNRIYVCHVTHHKIYMIDLNTGVLMHIAGSGELGNQDGDALSASFERPTGIAVSSDGTQIFITDGGEETRMRVIDLDPTLNTTEAAWEQIRLYPNPSATDVLIEFQRIDQIKQVQVYSVDGKLVDSILINDEHSILRIPYQTQGIYFVLPILRNGRRLAAKKVVFN